ncbi:hypothetical protein [Paracidovorax cattleyae]|uniref:hypothetical protein n=1 Tax=Paracidovorax cattleyae TaxID=80868 RepID=UPI001E594665|nr:hypothetical protein [Paracidovorax cattleyae]
MASSSAFPPSSSGSPDGAATPPSPSTLQGSAIDADWVRRGTPEYRRAAWRCSCWAWPAFR